LARRVESLRCEGSDAIGAKRTCRERRERVDLTKMTLSRHAAPSHFSEPLLDHLVGEREQIVGDFDAECLRGLEVDHELELGRL
jgi:hypothetical protein